MGSTPRVCYSHILQHKGGQGQRALLVCPSLHAPSSGSDMQNLSVETCLPVLNC